MKTVVSNVANNVRAQSRMETHDDDIFIRGVGVAFFVHVVVFALFAIRAAIFPDEDRLHLDAIRVDMVGLPDKIEKPLKPEILEKLKEKAPEPKIKEPPPPEPKAKELVKKIEDPKAINLNKNKKKEISAIEKLKQMDAINKLQDEEAQETRQKALAKLKQFKGAAVNSGSELHGVAKIEHEEYLAKIEKQIRRHWALPEWLAHKQLTAQVQVTFDENGQILNKKITKSSGNPSFDEIVLQTVTESAPVPPPPKEFLAILANEGILLGFPE